MRSPPLPFTTNREKLARPLYRDNASVQTYLSEELYDKQTMAGIFVATLIALIAGAALGAAGLVLSPEERSIGAGLFSTGFTTIFAAVLATMERRRTREDRLRERELELLIASVRGSIVASDVPPAIEPTVTYEEAPPGGSVPTTADDAPATPADEADPVPDATPEPEPQVSAEEQQIESELRQVRDRLQLPLIDWKRTIIATAILLIAVDGSLLLVVTTASGWDGIALLILWAAFLVFIVPFIIVGLGIYLGRASRARGFLGAVVMGAIAGALTLLIVFAGDGSGSDSSVSDIATAAAWLVGAASVLSAIGGWLGYKSRNKWRRKGAATELTLPGSREGGR